MAKRNGSILDDLSLLSWRVSITFAAVIYLSLRYLVPLINFKNWMFKGMATAAQVLAPFLAGILLLPAAVSAFNSWRKGQLLEKQTGIGTIRSISWQKFEELVGEAYRRRGYRVIENTAAGPDEGIDLVLKKGGSLILVQCKHWKSSKVGVNIVRELFGVMTAKHATSGILITSGVFTQEAKNFGADKPIDLVDGTRLLQLIGNVQKQGTTLPRPASANVCPQCGAELVLRTAQRGPNPGKKFWGCSDFPKCRFTKPLN